VPDGAVARFPNMQLAQYEAMRVAVAECVRIDEAADIRDKAAALAAYARQRDDKELENWVAEIKCRACVKIGRLSSQLPKAKTKGRSGTVRLPSSGKSKTESLADASINTTSADRYEELAEAEDAEPTKAEQYYDKCKAEGRAPTLGGLRNALKGDRRSEREVELAEATRRASKAIGKKIYSVIYADPPWRFEPYSRDSGMDRAADNHYPTMTIGELKELKVPAASNAVLFLWATNPMLAEALAVMQAWGFTYKSNFVWEKNKAGTGYWNRNKHELLLVGTKGSVPAPAPGEQYDSVIPANRGRHSAKPAAFIEIIDGMFPHLDGVELFARTRHLGWDVWGNEVPP